MAKLYTFKKLVPYSIKIEIKKSNIHGLGVFSKKNIKKCEVVFIIKGTQVVWEVKDKKTALYGQHWIGIGKNKWIDPVGYGRYINHSSRPNCGIKGIVTVHAMREIKKGEEITMDYATTEDQLLWHLQDSMSGQKVYSIQYLPDEKFKKYLPYIPKYFQNVYRKHQSMKTHG